MVRNLDFDDQLHTIALSEELWAKLICYATTVLQGITSRTHEMPEEMRPGVDIPFPPVEQQRQAAAVLQAWTSYYSLSSKLSAGVNCELSVQDEVMHSLVTPLNIFFPVYFLYDGTRIAISLI